MRSDPANQHPPVNSSKGFLAFGLGNHTMNSGARLIAPHPLLLVTSRSTTAGAVPFPCYEVPNFTDTLPRAQARGPAILQNRSSPESVVIARRLIILGGPASGKTTLARRLAAESHHWDKDNLPHILQRLETHFRKRSEAERPCILNSGSGLWTRAEADAASTVAARAERKLWA